MKVLVIILCLLVLNNLLLAVYCRFAEKMDIRAEKKRQKSNEYVAKESEVLETDSANSHSDQKHIIVIVYSKLLPYVYGWMRYCIVLAGKIPSHRIRNLLYRIVFNMKITKNTVIYAECELRSPWNIRADRCVISTNCILDGRRGIFIGEDVVFGSGVHVWTEEHDINDSYFAVNNGHAQPVHIGAHAWICSDSTILPGTNIGEGAVLASRAVATKDCEAFGVYGGVPAKRIGTRNNELLYQLNGKPTWHFY